MPARFHCGCCIRTDTAWMAAPFGEGGTRKCACLTVAEVPGPCSDHVGYTERGYRIRHNDDAHGRAVGYGPRTDEAPGTGLGNDNGRGVGLGAVGSWGA